MSSTILLGGIPTHDDLAPSILFAVLYALVLPLYAFRQLNAHSRSLALLRPGLFVLVRIATFCLRAAIAAKGGETDIAPYIVEVVFLTVGFVLICDPLIDAWASLTFPLLPPPSSSSTGTKARRRPRHVLEQVKWALKSLVIAVIALGIVIGALSGSASDDPDGSTAGTVKALRTANYIIAIVIVGSLLLVTGSTYARHRGEVEGRKAGHVLGTCAVLLVVAAYKLALSANASPTAWVHSRSAFFILLALPEFLATLSLFAVPWGTWYPSLKAQRAAHARLQEERGGEGSLEELQGKRAGEA